MQYREISGGITTYREKSGDIERNLASAGVFLTPAGDREVTSKIGSLPIKSGGLESMKGGVR